LRQAHWHEPPPPGPARAFLLDSVAIDLRHALRALRATPSFTLGGTVADIVDRARRLPGVSEASAASPGIPLRVNLWIDAPRYPGEPTDRSKTVSIKVVTAGTTGRWTFPEARPLLYRR